MHRLVTFAAGAILGGGVIYSVTRPKTVAPVPAATPMPAARPHIQQQQQQQQHFYGLGQQHARPSGAPAPSAYSQMHMRGNSVLGGGAQQSSTVAAHRRSATGSIALSGATLDSLHSSLAGAPAGIGGIGRGHSRQPSESDPSSAATTVHVGIGGAQSGPMGGSVSGSGSGSGSGAVSLSSTNLQRLPQQSSLQISAGPNASLATGNTSSASAAAGVLGQLGNPSGAHHSRHASVHTRQHSIDFDYTMAHASGDNIPTRSLWVGNVDPGLSNQDLVAIFGKYGRVESLRLLPDKECAFVNFLRVEDAIHAKEDMHAGARIGNNTVRVGYGKGESYAMGDAQAMQPTRALWIGNIAPSITPDALSTVFQAYGTIESARVLNHKNCGFVNFVRLEDAVRAKQAMNGKSIDGMVVRIGYAKVPAAKNESTLKLRNPVPSAAPLTVSGQIAEADAITGTTQRGLGSDTVLEPGFSLAIDEDLVAFPYATQLPSLPEPSVCIRPDPADGHSPSPSSSAPASSSLAVPSSLSSSSSSSQAVLHQSRLRDIRKLLESGNGNGSPIPQEEFDQIVAELMPHAVDLCTDYVGNVLIQKIAERGSAEQKLELVRRVGPHMTAIGVHKNGTWAVQKIIDTADRPEQRRAIVDSIKQYAPQLLLDQLGNYVVQCCLKFGAPGASSGGGRNGSSGGSANDKDNGGANDDAGASNQFAYDAIHARCLEIAQGRFGARAIRTCLESPYASKLQQKLVAVALVTNAVSLATNANGHLLMNWLIDSSKFPGRYRVLAHQLAPHLRYLATHKLGASTITKLVDQTAEPDARDLILNTLFFNPDPSVLDDVLLDQAQGIHVVLKILQGNAIGDTEKARIADRLRFVGVAADGSAMSSPLKNGGGFYQHLHGGGSSNNGNGNVGGQGHHRNSPSSPTPAIGLGSGSGGGNGSGSGGGGGGRSAGSGAAAAPSQRLADVVTSILAHHSPSMYPPATAAALSSSNGGHAYQSSGAALASASPSAAVSADSINMPTAHHYTGHGHGHQPHAGAPRHASNPHHYHSAHQSAPPLGFHFLSPTGVSGAAAMSFPAAAAAAAAAAGFGGMVAGGSSTAGGGGGGQLASAQQGDLLAAAAYYHRQQMMDAGGAAPMAMNMGMGMNMGGMGMGGMNMGGMGMGMGIAPPAGFFGIDYAGTATGGGRSSAMPMYQPAYASSGGAAEGAGGDEVFAPLPQDPSSSSAEQQESLAATLSNAKTTATPPTSSALAIEQQQQQHQGSIAGGSGQGTASA
ncbi:hypothetical protein GGI07_005308 [Coemansia sp. Benny D115]|nr:hypothetical protein GGI07_005308 [Coemansia sp. Benny D115]